jgi:hypothetical protein
MNIQNRILGIAIIATAVVAFAFHQPAVAAIVLFCAPTAAALAQQPLGAENRLLQLATSPLLTQFAISASQSAIRPIGQFLAPVCEVPDLTFRYKVYTEKNRYRIPSTKRDPGGRATRIGFTADDVSSVLEPNALDFPIPNVLGLSDEALQYNIQEGQTVLADVSALALENEIVSLAVAALTGGAVTGNYSNTSVDPIGDGTTGLDAIILSVVKAAKNGAPVKVLFGTNAFRIFRNNPKVQGKFVVAAGRAERGGGAVGTISPTIEDVGGLLISNPEVQLSMFVIDTSAPGQAESISFLLDTKIIVFAGNEKPNRFDPSFMKTFAPMGGFFKPGAYLTEDERDQILKMDWTTLPKVTNSVAAQLINVT